MEKQINAHLQFNGVKIYPPDNHDEMDYAKIYTMANSCMDDIINGRFESAQCWTDRAVKLAKDIGWEVL